MQKPDGFGCVGSTIKVAAGHYVDLSNPQPEMIDLESIASGLSKICRYGGQCPRFYSVAEHSVHATIMAALDGVELGTLRAILLHDAAEAYIGDIVKPLKLLLPEYAGLEERLEQAIAFRFNVDMTGTADIVKRYDRLMLKVEKTSMWPDDAEHWSGFGDIDDVDMDLDYLSPEDACRRFKQFATSLKIV